MYEHGLEGLSKPAYDNINDELHCAYENAGNKSMSKAAEEVKTLSQEKLESDTDIILCQCSIDGLWQKYGHSSLNGVVTAISNGKCADHHVLSEHCKGCQRWKAKKGTPQGRI